MLCQTERATVAYDLARRGGAVETPSRRVESSILGHNGVLETQMGH